MRKTYNPNSVNGVAPRPYLSCIAQKTQTVDPSTKAREKLEAVLGDSRAWAGDRDAIESGQMLRAVLGVSWQPKTLHSYRKRYWQQGIHWHQAPGPKGLVTFDILAIVTWWYQQQEAEL